MIKINFKKKFNKLSFIIASSLSLILVIILILSIIVISFIISYQSKIYDKKNKEVIVNLIRKDVEKKLPALILSFKYEKMAFFIKEISEKYGVIIDIKKSYTVAGLKNYIDRFSDEKCFKNEIKLNDEIKVQSRIFINPPKREFSRMESMFGRRGTFLLKPPPMGLHTKIPDALIVIDLIKNKNNDSNYNTEKNSYKTKNNNVYNDNEKGGGTNIKGYQYYIFMWFIKISRDYYINKIKNGLILVFLIGIVVSVILSIFFSKKISKFIYKLSSKMDEIAEGRYGQLIEYNNIEEINNLNLAFNKMSLKLKEYNEERKRITSNISHEIRTPLTILKSYMEGFRDKVLTFDEKTIDEVLDEITRLEKMVEDLKKLTELEYNKSIEKIDKEINLSEIAEDVLKKNRFIFKKENVKIIKNMQDVRFKMLESDFRSLLTNLMKNGIKYNDKKEKIIEIEIVSKKLEIQLDKRKNYLDNSLNGEMIKEKVRIKIRDNGIGIDQTHFPLIFERFYRVDPSRSSKTGGRGLGLSIVKEIVNKYNGKIMVKSEPNKYTEFIIEFDKV